MRRQPIRAAFRASLMSLSVVGPAVAQEINEFPIPAAPQGGSNHVGGIAVGQDGRLWFTKSSYANGGRIGWVPGGGNLATIRDDGIIIEYPNPCSVSLPFSRVGGPAVTADGNVWISTDSPPPLTATVTPCLTEFRADGSTLPSSASNLITGPDDNLWFVLPWASPSSSSIGRTTKRAVLTTFSLPVGTYATDIAAGPDGNIWFTDFTNLKVGRLTAGGSVTLFDLTATSGNPSAIAAGPDGNLWFIEANNQIGRMTTHGAVTDFVIPTPASQPVDIAAGADGAMWFTESIGKIGRITTAGEFSEIRVPDANAMPLFIAGKPDGTIWFSDNRGSSGDDRIGRLSPNAGCVSDPQTLCLGLGGFSVTASFQPRPGVDFTSASAVRLTDNTGYFWFFDPVNVEMTVKVLDGCAVNGHYWVFAGGMTNVGVQWKVTRTLTGDTKNYTNELGTAFAPVQDTAAFLCP